MSLIQKAQYLLLELSTAFARDDLDQFNFLLDGFLHDAIQLSVDFSAAVVDVVQIQFEFCHAGFVGRNAIPPYDFLERNSNGGR